MKHLLGLRLKIIGLVSSLTLATLTLSAQSDQSSEEPVFDLNPFVVSDSGSGYISGRAISGFKTKARLLDIPQTILVTPRSVIEDLGFTSDSLEILKYTSSGVAPVMDGEFAYMRGFRSSRVWQDGVPTQSQYNDPANLEAIEVIKGPAAVMYGQGSGFAGMINRITKVPQEEFGGYIRGTVGENGFYRGEFDATGKLMNFGDGGMVLGRIVVAYDTYDKWRENNEESHILFAPSIAFRFSPETTLLFQYTHTEVNMQDNVGNGFINEDGTGINRYSANNGYSAPWNKRDWKQDELKVTYTHYLGNSWNLQVKYTHADSSIREFGLRNNSGPNYETNEIRTRLIQFEPDYSHDVLLADMTGEFSIAGVRQQANLGFSLEFTDAEPSKFEIYDTQYPSTPLDDNSNRVNAPYPDFPLVDLNQGRFNYQESVFRQNIYYNQRAYFMDDNLILSAGIGYSWINQDRVSTASGERTFDLETGGAPYRLGAVYKITPAVAAYVNISENFSPQTGEGSVELRPSEDATFDIGFKVQTEDNRIVATVSYFDLTRKNISRRVPAVIPAQYLFDSEIGSEGIEIDVGVQITDGWTLIASGYFASVSGDDGERPADSIVQTSSLATFYRFREGDLEGLTLGLSAYHTTGRVNIPTEQEVINGIVKYQVNDDLEITMNVYNITDKLYVGGGWNSFMLSPGMPRSVRIGAKYSF